MHACLLVLVALVGGPEADIRSVLDAQVAAWNRKDLEGYMEGYWKSPDLVFQSGSTLTKGFEPTLERYRSRYQAAGREMGVLRFESLEILALGKDAALARGGWHLEMTGGVEHKGLFTLLLRRIDGAWRIVHDHSSGE